MSEARFNVIFMCKISNSVNFRPQMTAVLLLFHTQMYKLFGCHCPTQRTDDEFYRITTQTP